MSGMRAHASIPRRATATKHFAKRIAGGILALSLSAGTAWGIDIETITVTATVQQRLMLVFGGRTVSFGNLSPERGSATLPGILTFNVRSNGSWRLEVVATDDLRNLQRPQAVIPAERLLLRRVGESALQPLSKAAQRQVAEGGPLPAQGQDVRFDLQLAPRWEDQPGNYEVTLRFILSPRP